MSTVNEQEKWHREACPTLLQISTVSGPAPLKHPGAEWSKPCHPARVTGRPWPGTVKPVHRLASLSVSV